MAAEMVSPLQAVDAAAATWWSENFQDQASVEREDFVAAIKKLKLSTKDPDDATLQFVITHFIIADPGVDLNKYERVEAPALFKVTQEQLRLFLGRFGPWRDKRGFNILDNVWNDFFPVNRSCKLQPWFWGGRADRDKEDKLFEKSDIGVYLVRFSSGNSLSLTYRGSNGVRTIHVNKVGGDTYGFTCKSLEKNATYPSVTHLIATKPNKFKAAVLSPLFKLHEDILDPRKATGYYITNKTSEKKDSEAKAS